MPLPGGGTTRIKRCQSIWSNHTPRSMRIRWAMVHFGRMGSPNIYLTVHPHLIGSHVWLQCLLVQLVHVVEAVTRARC